MSFGLGFWATAGAGSAAAAGDYEQIATAFGTGSSGVITFSSIPQTYKHLQVRAVAKNNSSNTETARQTRITYNGVTTALYSYHQLLGTSGSVNGNEWFTSTADIRYGFGSAGSNTTGAFYATIFDILDYTNTSKNKTLRGLGGGLDGSFSRIQLGSGAYVGTDAISSLTFTLGTGNYDAATRFSLYGIKG
jgi:hypothetical protein